MTVQYQVDGNIFQEITANWLCAYVKEYLIKARQLDTDQAGNAVEHLQLNDGRVFTRLVAKPAIAEAAKASNTRSKNVPRVVNEQSLTQPR